MKISFISQLRAWLNDPVAWTAFPKHLAQVSDNLWTIVSQPQIKET
jgi:hypothetical protein